jgi:predicted nucleic acid-binding protein
MTALVFVDTNIWLYARDGSDPLKHRAATEALEGLWREGTGRTSLQVINEYFVNVTRKVSRPLTDAEAWADVEMMLAWRPRPVTADSLTAARAIAQRHRLFWWDALIVAAAVQEGCQVLLSEDFQHGQLIAGLRVRNPLMGSVSEPDGLPRPRRSRRTRLRPPPP